MKVVCKIFLFTLVFDLARGSSADVFNLTMLMPSGKQPGGKQSIHLAAVLPDNEQLYIVNFHPVVDRRKVRLITTYLCSEPYDAKNDFWFDRQPCGSMDQSMMVYEWHYSVPAVQWPKDAGLQVGANTPYRYVVIDIRYAATAAPAVYGEHITITRRRPKRMIGSYSIVTNGFDWQSNRADFSCKFQSSNVQLFAALFFSDPAGRSISLYRIRKNQPQMIIKGNLSWPQTFYQTENRMDVKMDDMLMGTCVYEETSSFPAEAQNAACQITLMFYTDQDDEVLESGCQSNDFPRAVERLLSSDFTPAPKTLFELNPAYPKVSPREWATMQMNQSSSPSTTRADNSTHILYLIYSDTDRHQELISMLRSHRLLIITCIWLLLMLLGVVLLAVVILRRRKTKKYPSLLKSRSAAITVGGETSSLSGWLTKRRFQQYGDDDKTSKAPLTGTHRWASDTEGSELSDAEVFDATDFRNVILRN